MASGRQSLMGRILDFTPKFSMALAQDISQTETLMSQSHVVGSHPINPHRPRCYPRQGSLCSTICLELPLLHPYGNFRIIWDTFILIVLIYTAIEIPLTIVFKLEMSLEETHGQLIFAADSILILDILLNFRTMYYDKWDRIVLHTDPFDIATHYLSGWFVVDFLTSFPIEFVFDDFINMHLHTALILKSLRAFRFVRILKIVRILRLTKNFDKFVELAKERELVAASRLIKIMAYMLLTAHYFACVWWYVGDLLYCNCNDDCNSEESTEFECECDEETDGYSSWVHAQGICPSDSLITKYSASWYWAIVTLFTTGYGDITAHNVEEQWVSSICIIIGSVFFAFFIGTLTSYLSGDADESKRNETDRVRQARMFCQHHMFDNELTRNVVTHIRYHCRTNVQSVCPHEEVLSLLPCFLQLEIREKVGRRLLAELDLFRNLPVEIIGQIALEMQSVSCNRGKYLFRRGDVAKHLYIQRTGEAVLHYSNGEAPRELRRGDVVGERALISGRRRFCVVASMWAEFWALNVDDIQHVLQRNFKQRRFLHEWIKIKRMVKDRKTGSGYKVERYCALQAGGDGSGAGLKRDIPRTMSQERSRISAVGAVAGWIEEKMTRRSANCAAAAAALAKKAQSELTTDDGKKSNLSMPPNTLVIYPTDNGGQNGNTETQDAVCDIVDRIGANKRQSDGRRRSTILGIEFIDTQRSLDKSDQCKSPNTMFSPSLDLPNNRRFMVPSRGNSTGPVNGPWNSSSVPTSTMGRDKASDSRFSSSHIKGSKSAHAVMKDHSSIGGQSSHFGNFLKSDSVTSWMTKISPFEIRHNSERRDQRVLAHTLKTMSMFAPSSLQGDGTNYLIEDGIDCSETNSMDIDEFSTRHQPPTRRVSRRERDREMSRSEREPSRDSQLIMALQGSSPFGMQENQPRKPRSGPPSLGRRASRKMNKFGGHQRPERRSRPQCKSAKSRQNPMTPNSPFSPMNRYGLLSPGIVPDLLSPDPPSDPDSSQLPTYDLSLMEEEEDIEQDLVRTMAFMQPMDVISPMDAVSPISTGYPHLKGIKEKMTDSNASTPAPCPSHFDIKDRRSETWNRRQNSDSRYYRD